MRRVPQGSHKIETQDDDKTRHRKMQTHGHPYRLTRQQLLLDLHKAYEDASRGKHGKPYVREFERHLEKELSDLRDELWNGTYKPSRAKCFPIHDPTMREVIAAQFRDCTVNHLYHNYTEALFERTFIADTYACIRGRGTHYGIDRLKRHIRSASRNYTVPCYCLQMDISGYFIHIQRSLLCAAVERKVKRMAGRRMAKDFPERWCDVLDVPFVLYLSRVLCLHNPVEDCVVLGSPAEWAGLPDSKSMRKAEPGRGVAIGNLDSQQFSNVFLDALDRFAKRRLHVRHYGRSVDDFYALGPSKKALRRVARRIGGFLKKVLDLEVNAKKTRIRNVLDGVRFLGQFILPHSSHVISGTFRRMRQKRDALVVSSPSPVRLRDCMNSWLGVMGHTDSFRKRASFCLPVTDVPMAGTFDDGYRKMSLVNCI